MFRLICMGFQKEIIKTMKTTCGKIKDFLTFLFEEETQFEKLQLWCQKYYFNAYFIFMKYGLFKKKCFFDDI